MPKIYNPQANIQRFIECVKKSLIDNPEYFEKLDFSEVTTFRIGCNNTFENIKCTDHTDTTYSVASKVYTKPKYTPCTECRSILRGRKQTGEASNGKMSVKDINKIINPKGITFVDESDYEQNANNYNYKTQFHCSKHDLVYIESPKNVMARGIETTCCPKCKEELRDKINKTIPRRGIRENETIIDKHAYTLEVTNGNTELLEYVHSKQKAVFRCKEHNRTFERYFADIRRYPGCGSCTYKETNIEKFMVNLLDTNSIKYLQNTKRQIKSESTGNALELDFFLPDYKLAIECHGLYWHSDAKSLKVSQRTPEIINENSLYIRRVLREKYYACKDQDINLLILFEDEILNSPEQVSNMILSKCGLLTDRIYARKTEAVMYSKTMKDKEIESIISDFFTKNHIQGMCNYKDAVLLLDNDDELVSCMLFNNITNIRGKKIDETEKELVRYATSKGTIVGGFSKALKFYLKEKPEILSIISYSDNRYSHGNVYATNNFVCETDSLRLDYEYVNTKFNQRFKKGQFQHKKLAKMEGFKYDPSLTEVDNCINNGYFRIWNLGRKKWVFNR